VVRCVCMGWCVRPHSTHAHRSGDMVRKGLGCLPLQTTVPPHSLLQPSSRSPNPQPSLEPPPHTSMLTRPVHPPHPTPPLPCHYSLTHTLTHSLTCLPIRHPCQKAVQRSSTCPVKGISAQVQRRCLEGGAPHTRHIWAHSKTAPQHPPPPTHTHTHTKWRWVNVQVGLTMGDRTSMTAVW
jgi:hypothetical protein